MRGLILAALAIGLLGLVAESRRAGERRALVFYGFLAYTLVCAGGVVESLRQRIELRDDEIRVITLTGSRSYSRAAVVEARWEKGCPVSLKLADGAWASLPSTGHGSAKVAGAIRAWLNER
jgi:hypothetical protein